MSATHLRSPRHAFERQQPTGSLELQEALRQENEQLRTALATRIVIEQAKGTRAERFEMHVNEAFERLRHQARSHRTKLHVLATAVTAREAWARRSSRRASRGTHPQHAVPHGKRRRRSRHAHRRYAFEPRHCE